jgi:hypothetical protein
LFICGLHFGSLPPYPKKILESGKKKKEVEKKRERKVERGLVRGTHLFFVFLFSLICNNKK